MFNKFAGLFVKIEDDKAPVQTPAPVTPQVAFTAPITPASAGQEDAEIKQQLAQALEEANQPGYDYFELAQSIKAQENIIPSESLRFQASFATASAMGPSVTPDKLIDSAKFYLTVLKKKEDDFNAALEKHVQETVTSKQDDINKYDSDMQGKAAQIKQLTEEINAIQAQKTAITNEISDSKSKIDQVRNNFFASMKVFTDKINSDIEKIKQYLMKA